MKKKYDLYQERVKRAQQFTGEQDGDQDEVDGEEERMEMRRKFIQLPMSKVRKVCAMDDEFRLIQKDALLLLTKATEMFMTEFGGTCSRRAKAKNKKTLHLQDILEVVNNSDKFYFVKDSKLPSLNPAKKDNVK